MSAGFRSSGTFLGYVAGVKVRVTGVLIEDDRILLLDQDTDSGRSWSLPGGKVDPGESLAEALVREMREETGLLVEPGRLLYVCDYQAADVLHMTFEVSWSSRRVAAFDRDHPEMVPIRGLEWVKLADLPSKGFSPRFADLAQDGFPGAGSYMGAKANIGL
ncbi:NUDIX hydrolase [Nonomuraea sp. NPDC049129]|uniref:NUDIX hydrolase n=1 Tax=Nonomuraea sp. NPDC049129 TaxID=3155272 RepID=UPI0033CC758F